MPSLGQPPLWHWQAGIGTGGFRQGGSDLMVRAELGAYHPPLNPITNLAELGVEAYIGARGSRADGGVRALFRIPYLGQSVGADYNLRDGRADLLIAMRTAVRRGGLLTPGTLLRINWYPTLNNSFTVGVSVPLGEPLTGRGRPQRDYVEVAGNFDRPLPHRATPAIEQELRAPIESLRVSAEWIRRMVVPFLDQDGRSDQIALERTTRYLAELRAHLAVRSVDDEVRFFHSQLERLFTVASGSAEAGRELARQSRQIVLDQILLPYNRLLGRKKSRDNLGELAVAARGQFGRWIAASTVVPADSMVTENVLFAFQALTDILEGVRRRAAVEWDAPRLVWLPLQYALLPEDYDERAELESLLRRATAVPFTDHNRISYIANLQFHRELLRMIHQTQSYHVLWIHDFPAERGGALDWASFEQVVHGYLAALTERVASYDATHRLPSYFIFLDEHYYEERRSRVLMNVLEDPLRASFHLSLGTAEQADALERALARLRAAVRNNSMLQAEAREYGSAWLRNRIKVHVNITNRVDPSFLAGGLVSTLFAYPDDLMRDHRKIAFRDVSEDDPFNGEAILTGMGVGTEYLGPRWDDRALMVRGPVLLQIRQAARDLLLSQGLSESDFPPPLRERPAAEEPLAQLAVQADAARFDSHAMALVNGTGYLPKPLNVAKALLYSLMPPGSVFKAPDSQWNSTFYAALLVGASLRGAHVLIIAPALHNAPGEGFPQMERTHELFTRLLLVRRELGAAIAAAGGEVRAGLYALPIDAHGFSSRADLWARQVAATPFIDSLLPFAAALAPAVAEWGGNAAPLGDCPDQRDTLPERPKLHLKVQFLATRELWAAITRSDEWPAFMTTYLRYRAATYSPGGQCAEAGPLSDSLEQIAERIIAGAGASPGAASFAIVGSQNQDYRGMFMDGEVGMLFTGAESLVPLIDLVFMVGTVTWVDDQQSLDDLLPPYGEFMRRFARVAKDHL